MKKWLMMVLSLAALSVNAVADDSALYSSGEFRLVNAPVEGLDKVDVFFRCYFHSLDTVDRYETALLMLDVAAEMLGQIGYVRTNSEGPWDWGAWGESDALTAIVWGPYAGECNATLTLKRSIAEIPTGDKGKVEVDWIEESLNSTPDKEEAVSLVQEVLQRFIDDYQEFNGEDAPKPTFYLYQPIKPC